MKTIHLKLIRQEQGSTLVVYMFILAAMAAIAIASLQSITLNLETANAHKKGKNAFYSAEVGLDLAVNDIINEFEDLTPYTDSGGFTIPQTYRDYDVSYNITNPLDPFLYQTVVGDTPIYHYAYTYNVQAVSTSNNDSSTETVNEQVRILETPLIQYFIFFGQQGNAGDIVLTPGPTMNLWGRIHSNADIYMGSSGRNKKMYFRNYDDNGAFSPHLMSAAGNIYPKSKATSAEYRNTLEVKTSSSGSTFTPIEIVGVDITSSNEVTEEERFNNFVLVNETPYTTPGQSQFERGGFYEDRSKNPEVVTVDGISILGTGGLGAGNIQITVSRPNPATDVTDLVLQGESSIGVSAGLPIPIIRETLNAFGDCREGTPGVGRNVDTTDIDLNLLELWYEEYLQDQDLQLAGGGLLIYASRSPDSSFTNQNGNLQAIRLMQLDPTSAPQLSDETTLATDNPVYIQGDFNTVSTKGVAIIGDAINILSNAFTNKVCGGDTTNLINNYSGTETTVNAALFGGNVPTNVGDGITDGVHSYPRLHEYWTPRNLNILGSFINLWTSTQATGTWCLGGDCYSGPTRNWGWDVRFADPDFWPPFIPSIYSVERVGFLE